MTVEISRVKKGYPTHTLPEYIHCVSTCYIDKSNAVTQCYVHHMYHHILALSHYITPLNITYHHILTNVTHNTMLNTCTILAPYTCTLHPSTIGCSSSITEDAVCGLELRAGPAEFWPRLMNSMTSEGGERGVRRG